MIRYEWYDFEKLSEGDTFRYRGNIYTKRQKEDSMYNAFDGFTWAVFQPLDQVEKLIKVRVI